VSDSGRATTAIGELPALRRRLWVLAALLVLLLGLAAAWSWTPLRDWLAIERVVNTLEAAGRRFGAAAAIAVFAAACMAVVPLTFLTLVTIVAFGPVWGFVYAMGGACLGGAASYWLGRALGREAVQHMAGERVNVLSRRLAGHGMLAVIAVRMVPVAPFAIVNLIAGASHIRFRDFLLGNTLGMAPGTLAMAVFVDQIVTALRAPGGMTFALVLLTLALIGAGGWQLRRWLRRATDS
jgi:uncharacterized membrane protein YdjX (TVP38/TMEM64 family)